MNRVIKLGRENVSDFSTLWDKLELLIQKGIMEPVKMIFGNYH